MQKKELKQKLLIKILNSFSESKNIKEIKKKLVTETGTFLNLQTCCIYEFDENIDNVLPLDEYGQYFVSEEYFSDFGTEENIKINKDLIELIKQKKEIIFSSLEELFTKYQIVNYKKELLEYYKKYKIKSGIILPILYSNELLGVFAVNYGQEKIFQPEELEFLRILSFHFGAIFYQTRLYEKEKLTVEREKILINMIEKIRSSLDTQEIKNYLVTTIASYFKADRCFIFEYDQIKNIFPPIETEYLSSPDIKSILSKDIIVEARDFTNLVKSGQNNIIKDSELFIKENKENLPEAVNFLTKYNIKSDYGFGLFYKNIYYGAVVVHFVKKKKCLSDEELNFLELLVNQAGTALYQANLYEKEKQTAKREQLLINIISTIRSSLDIKKIKKEIISNIGLALNAQRVFIIEFNENTQKFLPVKDEFLSSPKIKSIIGFNAEKEASELANAEKIEPVIIEDTDKFLLKNNLQNSLSAKHLKYYGMKSGFSMPLLYANKFLGGLVIHFTKRTGAFGTNEIQFVKTIADQTSIALYQADLFKKERSAAQRADLFAQIITTFRSYLEPNEIKQSIVSQIGEAFKADRCFFVEFDENDHAIPIDKYAEYLPLKDEESLIDIDLESYDFKYWAENLKKEKKEVIYIDAEDYIKKNNLQGTKLDEYSKRFNFKAGMGFPLFKDGKITGLFVLNYSKPIEFPSWDDINFLKTLVEQIDIALYQAKLFEKVKQTAEKEKVLREIISTIGSSYDIEKSKELIVTKIGKTLKANRCFIYEYNPKKPGKRGIFAEYISSDNVKKMAGADVNREEYKYWEKIMFAPEFRKGTFVNDIEQWVIDSNLQNTAVERHYKEYSIKTAIGMPIYYHGVVYGQFIVQYTEKKVNLMEDDLEFMRVIANQTGAAIYQYELYEAAKQTAQREKLLRELITTVRSTLDIEKTKNSIVNSIGKTFNTSRCFIIEFDKDKGQFIGITNEYLASPEVKSVIGLTPDIEVPRLADVFKKGGSIFIDDLDKFISENQLKETKTAEFLYNFDVLSGFAIPIYYGESFLGTLVNHYDKKYAYTNEDVEFVKIFAAQTGIALDQANLYEIEQKTAKREKLLRELIETIRSTLDLNIAFASICEKVAKLFNVQRVSIVEQPDKKNFDNFRIRYEYKSDIELTGLAQKKPIPGLGVFLATYLIDNFVLGIDDFRDPDTPQILKDYYIDMGVKSLLAVAIQQEDVFWGTMVISEYKKHKHWTDDDKALIKSIVDQVYISIRQAELYEKEKQTADKQRLLKETISNISSTLDIDEIKKNLTHSLGKFLNLDRCLIREYIPEYDNFLPINEYIEYRSSKDIKSIVGVDLSSKNFDFFKNAGKKGIETFEGNAEEYLNSHKNEVSKALINYFKEFEIKAGFQLPIFYGDQFLGVIAGHYSKIRPEFTEDEKAFIRSLSRQAGIAIYKSKLYEKEKQTAKREKVLRNSIETIRSTLDLNKIRKELVTGAGEVLNASRAYFTIFDDKTNRFLNTDEYSEYLRTPNEGSLIGTSWEDFPPFGDMLKKKQEVVLENSLEYAQKNKLTKIIFSAIKTFNIKAIVVMPIYYYDKLLGALAVHFDKISRFTEEDLNFLRTISDQAAIAIHQTEIYEKEKLTAERERILRSIIEKLRSSLDIKEIKNYLVNTIGLYFQADRCFIHEIAPHPQIEKVLEVGTEYLSSPDIKSFSIENVSTKVTDIVNFIKTGKNHIIKDTKKFIEKNKETMPVFTQFLIDYEIKSDYGFGIFYQEKALGSLVVQFIKEKRELTDEEIDFLQSLANQAGIAIYQARLYEKERQKAEKEQLLREIIATTREILDIEEVKNRIVTSIGKTFNLSRCFIIEFDKVTGNFLPLKNEYLSSSNEKSLLGTTANIEVPEIAETLKKEMYVYDADKFIEENNLQGTQTAEFMHEYNIKSSFAIPIYYRGEVLGVLESLYNKKDAYLEEDVQFIKTFADQIGIALYQAKLYEKEKQTAEREILLRKIIQTIRSTLDLDKIKKEIVKIIATTIKADRCFIAEFDQNEGKYIPLRYEYVLSPNIPSMVEAGFDPNIECPELVEFTKAGNEIISRDFLGQYIKENKLEGTLSEEFFKRYNILSGFGIPLFYGDQFFGTLSFHYVEKVDFSEEEVDFVRDLANQVAIAIYQSKLFEKERQTAKKETLLREIISEIRYSQSLDEAYNYILAKIAEIFDMDRCIFLETPNYKYESPSIRYDHRRKKRLKSIKNITIPEKCFEKFQEAGEQLTPAEIHNIPEIGSIMAIPLVRYNRSVKLLGILALCSLKQKKWDPEELELLKTITNSVVNVVWDITKLIEIEELRNTFTLTLAHDLQIPVLGEKKALEFINSKPEDMQIKNIKPILTELLKNNLAINNMLSKLIEIYNYEMKNKLLEFSEHTIEELIRGVYHSLESFIFMKSIKVDIIIQKNLPIIKVDKDQLKTVIFNILENAIIYTPEKGKIIINCYKSNDEVVTCISDSGPGIKPEIENVIFERYGMAKVIERKIGSGLSLYLAKLIIESHDGKIWYETKLGNGTTFCFTLKGYSR